MLCRNVADEKQSGRGAQEEEVLHHTLTTQRALWQAKKISEKVYLELQARQYRDESGRLDVTVLSRQLFSGVTGLAVKGLETFATVLNAGLWMLSNQIKEKSLSL